MSSLFHIRRYIEAQDYDDAIVAYAQFKIICHRVIDSASFPPRSRDAAYNDLNKGLNLISDAYSCRIRSVLRKDRAEAIRLLLQMRRAQLPSRFVGLVYDIVAPFTPEEAEQMAQWI